MSHFNPPTAGFGSTFKRLFAGAALVLLSNGVSEAQSCTDPPAFKLDPVTDFFIGTDATSCNITPNYSTRIEVTAASGATSYSHIFTGATIDNNNTDGLSVNFNKGTTHVIITATNACGTTIRSFNVIIADQTGPNITQPDLEYDATPGLCGRYVTFAPTMTDNCPACDSATITATLQGLGFTPLGSAGGYYDFTHHWYFLTPAISPDNFDVIDNAIDVVGGHFVSITSAQEQGFIQDNTPLVPIWIGLTDRDQEGVFKWVDGSPFVYSNWCNLQPDDQGHPSSHQNYALIHSQGTDNYEGGCWDDGHSPYNPVAGFDNKFMGILEIDRCGTALKRTAGPASGDFFPVGTTPVTYQGTDASGNVVTKIFNVKINGGVTCSLTHKPSDTTFTGGIPTNIYLGYGAQSDTITVVTTGTIASYLWEAIGTAPISYLSCTNCKRPIFKPLAAGDYEYKVTVTGTDGCKSVCTVKFCVRSVLGTSGNCKDRIILCHYPDGNPNNPQTQCHKLENVDGHIRNHELDALGDCSTLCGAGARIRARTAASMHAIGEEVEVYPNPTTNTFFMDLPYFEKSATVTLTDIQGKVLMTRSFNETDDHHVRFDLQNNAVGIYILNVKYDDHVYRTKLVRD